LEIFAREHNLKIGTVADLIEYRIRTEKTVERITESKINTKFGSFRLVAFQESISLETHLVLVKGVIDYTKPIVIRVHMLDSICDLFSVTDGICGRSLEQDMQTISSYDNAVLVVLRKDKDDSIIKRIMLHGRNEKAPVDSGQDLRMFGVGAQILADLGVGKMIVLGTSHKLHGLAGFGLEIVDYISHEDD